MHFTDKQLQHIKEENEEMLHALGYVCDGRDEKTWNYINYEGKHSKNSEEKLNAYKYINAHTIKQRLAIKPGDLPDKKISFSTDYEKYEGDAKLRKIGKKETDKDIIKKRKFQGAVINFEY